MAGLGWMRVNLQEYKVLFLVVTAVLALFVASPVLQRVLVYPQTEFFTEMWLVGPGHMAEDFPYNITRGEEYNLFLGVGNHLGECAYYVVEVKFRNATQSAPDSFNRTYSSLEPLYSFNVVVADKESLELPLRFSFDYSFDEVARVVYQNVSVRLSNGTLVYQEVARNVTLQRVNFGYLKLNDSNLSLQGFSSDFDSEKHEFFGNLVFELWIYNGSTSSFGYHERYVDLKFNMTRT
jgi:hypothetical protein